MYSRRKKHASTAARKSSSGPQVPPSGGDERTLIDKFGHRHSQRVLTIWSPAVQTAMGIRPIEASGEGSKRA